MILYVMPEKEAGGQFKGNLKTIRNVIYFLGTQEKGALLTNEYLFEK